MFCKSLARCESVPAKRRYCRLVIAGLSTLKPAQAKRSNANWLRSLLPPTLELAKSRVSILGVIQLVCACNVWEDIGWDTKLSSRNPVGRSSLVSCVLLSCSIVLAASTWVMLWLINNPAPALIPIWRKNWRRLSPEMASLAVWAFLLLSSFNNWLLETISRCYLIFFILIYFLTIFLYLGNFATYLLKHHSSIL